MKIIILGLLLMALVVAAERRYTLSEIVSALIDKESAAQSDDIGDILKRFKGLISPPDFDPKTLCAWECWKYKTGGDRSSCIERCG
jgi:hypothetical protein